jgi:RNA polymerase sigma-70 factor (ECF subfamily)
LIDILRALPSYRVEGAIVHYTNRIALRASIAARKRARNREQRLSALAEQTPLPNPAGSDDHLPNLWLVRGIIDELSSVQAETVLMRMVLGFSVEETAAATQVPVNTVKSRLRLAKDYMRSRLDGETVGWEGRA